MKASGCPLEHTEEVKHCVSGRFEILERLSCPSLREVKSTIDYDTGI